MTNPQDHPAIDAREAVGPSYDLDLCPWCAGPADFENLENGRYSVGCNDSEGECLGFQLMTTFATKREAQKAWNRRASNNPAAVEGQGEAVTISRRLYDFLMGVGEIDGTGFGDLQKGLAGSFWWRALLEADARDQERSSALAPAPGQDSFQARVAPWMQQCFGPTISNDRVERGDRFLEEALELLQSGGYDPARIPALVEYVWSRPVGEPSQEVGGVMVTLAAYCLAYGLDMHEAGETELARINVPAIIEKIRVKQATKAAAIGNTSPLPIAPNADREGV
jgi:hypothetical protein